MDYINIKIGNERYIQRNEYNKISIIHDNGTRFAVNSIDELPPFQRTIINTLLDVEKRPSKYFDYEEDTHSITITEYYGKLNHLVLPREIYGKKVTNIKNIFEGHNEIESIFFSDTISKLPSDICLQLRNLKFVQLPSILKTIPPAAFLKCSSLKYINLENIEKIESYGFEDCGNLEEVDLRNIKTVRPFGFAYCRKLKSANMPNIEYLHGNSFAYCDTLESIYLGNNLSKIDQFAFFHCEDLKYLRLPNELLEIEKFAFCNCSSLSEVNFPETILTIGECAFVDTDLSGTINLPKSLTDLGPSAFYNENIKEVNISKDTKYKKNTFCKEYTKIKTYEETKITRQIEEER